MRRKWILLILVISVIVPVRSAPTQDSSDSTEALTVKIGTPDSAGAGNTVIHQLSSQKSEENKNNTSLDQGSTVGSDNDKNVKETVTTGAGISDNVLNSGNNEKTSNDQENRITQQDSPTLTGLPVSLNVEDPSADKNQGVASTVGNSSTAVEKSQGGTFSAGDGSKRDAAVAGTGNQGDVSQGAAYSASSAGEASQGNATVAGEGSPGNASVVGDRSEGDAPVAAGYGSQTDGSAAEDESQGSGSAAGDENQVAESDDTDESQGAISTDVGESQGRESTGKNVNQGGDKDTGGGNQGGVTDAGNVIQDGSTAGDGTQGADSAVEDGNVEPENSASDSKSPTPPAQENRNSPGPDPNSKVVEEPKDKTEKEQVGDSVWHPVVQKPTASMGGSTEEIGTNDWDMSSMSNDRNMYQESYGSYTDEEAEEVDGIEGKDEDPRENLPVVNNVGKFTDDEDSHFFAYFLTIMVTAIIFYLVFHNKQRIIALIIEGRAPGNGRSRRTSSRARYHKLDNNLEEAITATKGTKKQ